jgi:hypothetical protein
VTDWRKKDVRLTPDQIEREIHISREHIREARRIPREQGHILTEREAELLQEVIVDLNFLLPYMLEYVQMVREDNQGRVAEALDIARAYGSEDGSHHKMWCIDQIVRALTRNKYAEWIKGHNDGELGPDTYSWDEGLAP